MKHKIVFLTLFTMTSRIVFASSEGMPSMPLAKPIKTYTVEGNENFEKVRGFGENEPMVRMMNLMMVEGSDYEGMDMDGMAHMTNTTAHENKKAVSLVPLHSEVNSSYIFELKSDSSKFIVGNNLVKFLIKSANNNEPVTKLNLTAEVYMTSMDMGTHKVTATEDSPGNYSLQAKFTMEGPWAIKLIFPNGQKIFNFDINSEN